MKIIMPYSILNICMFVPLQIPCSKSECIQSSSRPEESQATKNDSSIISLRISSYKVYAQSISKHRFLLYAITKTYNRCLSGL